MTETTDSAMDMVGLGPAAPEHRDGRDERGPYEEPTSEADGDAISEVRLIHRLLRLGGEIPEDRWQRIDERFDELLASEELAARDTIRIAQVQAARERVVAAAVGKVLDKQAGNDTVVDQGNGPIEVVVEYVDDYYGAAAAAEGRLELISGEATSAPLPTSAVDNPQTNTEPVVRRE